MNIDDLVTFCVSRTQLLFMICAENDRFEPASFEVNGRPWACATDGFRMLAIRDMTVSGKMTDATRETIARWILSKPAADSTVLRVTRERLATWVGDPPQEPERTDCSRCDSTGAVECSGCHGMGDCECPCGHEHKCAECDGEGEVKCTGCKNVHESHHERTMRRRRLGTVNGVVYNRTLFHEALATLTTDEVVLEARANKTEPLLLRATDDRVVFAVMAMDSSFKADDDAPELVP